MALSDADAGRAGIRRAVRRTGQRVHEQPRAADGGQAEHRVCLGANRIVDLGHDVLDAECLGRELRGEGVAVVALGQREEPVRGLRADARSTSSSVPSARIGLAGKVRLEAVESVRADVDDRDVVTRARQSLGQARPDAAATHDHCSHW